MPDCYFILKPSTRTLFGPKLSANDLEALARKIIDDFKGVRGSRGGRSSMIFRGSDGRIHVFVHFDGDTTAKIALKALNSYLGKKLGIQAALLYPLDV